MHPEVRQKEPGSCPICGMTLEPVAPSPSDGGSVELSRMTRRLIVSTVLSVPLLVVAMGGMFIPWIVAHQRPISWFELALVTPVVL